MKHSTIILSVSLLSCLACNHAEETQKIEQLDRELNESFSTMYSDIEQKSKMRTNSDSHLKVKVPENVEPAELP